MLEVFQVYLWVQNVEVITVLNMQFLNIVFYVSLEKEGNSDYSYTFVSVD